MNPYEQLRQYLMALMAKSYPTQAGASPMAMGGALGYPVTGAALGAPAANYGQVSGGYAPYGGPSGQPGISSQALRLPGGDPSSQFDQFVPRDINDPATRRYYATALGQGRNGGDEANQFYNATGEQQYQSYDPASGTFG